MIFHRAEVLVKGHKVTVRNVNTGQIETHFCDALAICTGLHVEPAIPEIPGIEHALRLGKVIHSSAYKTRDQLAGRRLLVIGSGETGHDVAYEAVQAGWTEVVMCHRDGFLSFPKVLNDFTLFGMNFNGDLPIDGLITNLFETAYVHPWVAKSRIRWHASDFIVQRVLWLLTGTRVGCDQWAGELPPNRLGRAFVFLNKSSKAMPYINKPFKRRSRLMNWISSYREPPEVSQTDMTIDLAPFPSHFLPSGRVIFCDSQRKEAKRMSSRKVYPEVVVFATGYQHRFDWLDSSYPKSDDCDVRDIVRSGAEDVAFIGFVRPGVGAIPPICELQAMFWTLLLLKRMPLPTTPAHYHLLQPKGARITHGVDHGAYSSQLARDMGSAPSVTELLTEYGLKMFLIYSFGAAFVPFYRLVGPWRDPSAAVTARTELAETIARRGVLGNLFMGVIPMVTYMFVNAVAFISATVWEYVLLGIVQKIRVKSPCVEIWCNLR